MVARPADKKDRYVWTKGCEHALIGLQEALCNVPVLGLSDLAQSFEAVCDACGAGLGAVLLQKSRPIALEEKSSSRAKLRCL